jgi:glycosyltransferase involved in cell wall biosynthesis
MNQHNSKTLLSINNYYYPRGGAEVLYLRHNAMFFNKGWSIIPFSMKHSKNIKTIWTKYFISEIEFGQKYNNLQKAFNSTKVVFSLEARRKIANLIKNNKVDLCHCHNIYHHISPSILPVLKRNGIPVVMTLHDLKLGCPNYQMLAHDGICERCKGGKYYNVLKHRCIKNNLGLSALIMIESYFHNYLEIYEKNVDVFIVPSRFYLKKLVEWGIDHRKLAYIPNYLDENDINATVEAGEGFLYFGRLSKEKGLKTLIRAANKAEVELKIAGDGPMKEELKALSNRIGGKVDFLGYLNGKTLKDEISKCRATVLPSEWYENAPISVKESYGLGKPVIGARIGGIPELIIENETGYTFESGSIDQLSDILRKVNNFSDNSIVEMGLEGKKLVKDNLNQELYFRRISSLYSKLL